MEVAKKDSLHLYEENMRSGNTILDLKTNTDMMICMDQLEMVFGNKKDS